MGFGYENFIGRLIELGENGQAVFLEWANQDISLGDFNLGVYVIVLVMGSILLNFLVLILTKN
jgi:hypothetical protein